jgi:geranylgeranyl transferase type-2 subunit alpha
MIKPSESTVLLQEELALTALFLSLDERNFHCWNYRRFVVACLAGNWSGEWRVVQQGSGNEETETVVNLMGPQALPTPTTQQNMEDDNTIIPISPANTIPLALLQSELDFTTAKIQDNFSNFSAFHYRSQLLEFLVIEEEDEKSKESCYLQEFQLMEDAICTEPDDQTAWWYHAILLDKLEKEEQQQDGGGMLLLVKSPTLQSKLQEQAALFRELLEDLPGKWVMLGLLRVLPLLLLVDQESPSSSSSQAEQRDLLERLITTDPDRAGRYQTMLQQLQK